MRYLITIGGLKNLESELARLKTIERPAIIEAISEARSHGDLSENAEYSSAKDKQSMIESRINSLEQQLQSAEIVDYMQLISSETVVFGSTVTLLETDTDKQYKYQIVGDYESDASRFMISHNTPLAKAILSKKIGDSVEFLTPKSIKKFEILAVEII